MPDKPRTLTQNRALHKFFSELATELNDNGLTVNETLRQDIEIPWNETLIKELLWRRVQKAQLGKDSTTELTTKEIDLVFEVIAQYLAENHSIVIEFPSIQTLMMQQRIKHD